MSRLHWTVGEVEIFQLVELEAGDLIQSIIKGASPENILGIPWLRPHFADAHGKLKALVQCFLIRSGSRHILVDTCNGNDKPRTDVPEWSNLQVAFLEQLSEIGVSPEQVDVVACTHLHMDHIGWNTRLSGTEWVPTFPNAQYLFAREEYAYWEKKPEKEIADDKAAFDDSVTPILKAGLARLVEVDHKIDQHVRFRPTPGHTPFHVSVIIESKDERAVISGDFLHHPCQIARPEWPADADTYPRQAVETRTSFLSELAEDNTLLIGTHFANPVAGRVVRRGAGFVLDV